jgi:hypothetical protein
MGDIYDGSPSEQKHAAIKKGHIFTEYTEIWARVCDHLASVTLNTHDNPQVILGIAGRNKNE